MPGVSGVPGASGAPGVSGQVGAAGNPGPSYVLPIVVYRRICMTNREKRPERTSRSTGK